MQNASGAQSSKLKAQSSKLITMSSIFGKIFQVSTFGESHGVAIGAVVDGMPPGVKIDMAFIQSCLDKRKPGQSKIVTQRAESDIAHIYSGVFEGVSTGHPIGIIIFNEDQRSKDYSHIADKFRPSHADYTYQEKYGVRDYRGGGRSSARETVARVAAGALAQLFLQSQGIEIQAYVNQVGSIATQKNYVALDLRLIEQTPVRCPDLEIAAQMIERIEKVKKAGDSIGGVITCVAKNVPVGLGEPAFDKLHADLGKAILSINACKGFEIGSGFDGVTLLGSEHNDVFYTDESGRVRTRTNHSGGVQGGISNGEDIYFKAAFKAVATIIPSQKSINEAHEEVDVAGRGRHDPCVLPRAVPIVEAMTALVLADHLLRNKIVARC